MSNTNITFFDQFGTIFENLNPYINNFSSSQYTISFPGFTGNYVQLRNLFTNFQLEQVFIPQALYFFNYTIPENERIDQTSYKVYGDVQYWCVIALFNNFTNIFNDYPLSMEELSLKAQYLTENEGLYSYYIYFNLLSEANENKRNIKILKPDILPTFLTAFSNYVSSLNG